MLCRAQEVGYPGGEREKLGWEEKEEMSGRHTVHSVLSNQHFQSMTTLGY